MQAQVLHCQRSNDCLRLVLAHAQPLIQTYCRQERRATYKHQPENEHEAPHWRTTTPGTMICVKHWHVALLIELAAHFLRPRIISMGVAPIPRAAPFQHIIFRFLCTFDTPSRVLLSSQPLPVRLLQEGMPGTVSALGR